MPQTWSGWQQAVLKAGGWPVTPQNVRFLTTWNDPYEKSACNNNPLDTTLRTNRSTNCVQTSTRGVWVQSYPSHAAGATATASTLKEGFFFAIAAALKSGNPFTYPDSATVALQIATWGTHGFADWYLQQAGGTQTGSTAPPTAESATTAGHRGYADLRNSVARHLPTQLRYSRRAGEATARILAHHHGKRGR